MCYTRSVYEHQFGDLGTAADSFRRWSHPGLRYCFSLLFPDLINLFIHHDVFCWHISAALCMHSDDIPSRITITHNFTKWLVTTNNVRKSNYNGNYNLLRTFPLSSLLIITVHCYQAETQMPFMACQWYYLYQADKAPPLRSPCPLFEVSDKEKSEAGNGPGRVVHFASDWNSSAADDSQFTAWVHGTTEHWR